MADDGSDGSESVWPIPKFYFCIELDGQSASFQEVSGLEVESQSIEYRAGDSKSFSTINMPGIKKTGSVTLKKAFLPKTVYFLIGMCTQP